jgi:hypothetical protein
MGATIVDALDTLIIMDMIDEANDAIEWIEEHLSFDTVRVHMRVLIHSRINAYFEYCSFNPVVCVCVKKCMCLRVCARICVHCSMPVCQYLR